MDGGPLGDDRELPWLAPVDDLDEAPALSGRKMLAALLMVVAAAALVAATFFLIGRDDPAPGGPIELIRAPDTPYKVRPTDPGGLDVAGDSETAFATGAGVDTDAQLDSSKLSPDQRPAPPPEAQAPPRPEPAPAEPAPTVSGGAVIQLGAYGSTAKAETAWTLLSGRFPEVAALAKRVERYSGGYRLRAVAPSDAVARAACKAVAAGGENCFLVR